MPHTLLLADDSLTIQRVIELTFADEDIRVIAVSDGAEAIAALDRDHPDIVLADVGMPGHTGYDVARHVRDTPALADIPVLLLTGAFDPVDQAKVDEVGCAGVLAKPFEPQLVIARVKELLSRPKAEATARHSPADASPAERSSQADVDAASVDAASLVATFPAEDTSQKSPDFEAVAKHFSALTTSARDNAPHNVEPPRPTASATADPTPSVPFPPLADAFAALLDAEQSGTAPPAVGWPAATPATASLSGTAASFAALPQSGPAPSPAPALPDDFADQVARQVLEQMSDRIVRETVADIVSKVAERLVREEIEKIKREIR